MTTTAPLASNEITLIKTQLEQLKEQYEAGNLTEQTYNDSRSALERCLLDWVLNNAATLSAAGSATPDVAPAAGTDASTTVETLQKKSTGVGILNEKVAIVCAVLVAVAAGGVYFWHGHSTSSPAMTLNVSGAISAAQPFLGGVDNANSPHTAKVDDISVMADKLAARLQKQPNDPQGWAILARSYDVLGNLPEALKAYAKAAELLPDDANLKADYAKAIAKAANNEKASGVDASVKPAETTPLPAATGSASVSGTVTLSAALKKDVQPEDTLFVLARPQEGSRMPLAILRRQVKDLPLHFVLDDSLSMSPVAKLSNAGKVVVIARISKSGNAAPAMGDVVGQSAPVAVGTKDLKIEIDTAVKP
jgi:cytochrome c-type biogenesis protein CcmH/NrfG